MKKSKDKKPKTWVLQAQLISVLRRLFVKSPMFQATRKAAQRERKVVNKDGSVSKAHRVEYQCAICKGMFLDRKIEVEENKGTKKGNKIKKYHEIAVDHVEPCVPVEGLPKLPWGDTDWNILIDRMMLGVEVWNPGDTYERIKTRARILCWKCHEKVTLEQNQQRKIHRDAKKDKNPKTKPAKKSKIS
jgi:hypothetical protein